MRKLLPFLFLLTFISCDQKKTEEDSSDKKDTVIAENKSKSSTPEPQSSNPNWKTLDAPGYSIQYPTNWQEDRSGEMGTSFFLYAPAEASGDNFRENINLLIQDLTGKNIDLDKYTEISEGQVKTMVINSRMIESKRVKNGSTEYQLMIYSGDQSKFHLQWEQHYWVINEKAYVLTLTCEASKFADYKPTGESILNSFKFK